MPSKLKPYNARLEPRDYDFLLGLFKARLMENDHIAALYFNGNKGTEKKRRQDLQNAGYIRERPRRNTEKARYFLTTKAFLKLKEKNKLNDYPSLSPKSFEKRTGVKESTIIHEMQVMDVRAALEPAISVLPFVDKIKFETWPVLYQFMARPYKSYEKETIFKPDGFIRVDIKDDPNPDHFFLEVDLSSEVQHLLGNKAVRYLDYYFSGKFARSNGSSSIEDFPFLVLMVVQNPERRNNTAERLLTNNPPTRSQAWLTTYDEVIKDPLGSIWVVPKEYNDVIKGSIYDLDRRVKPLKPHSPREAFVEQSIKKHRLLE